MVGYKLSKNDWVTPFFVIFRSVREKLLVTVFFDHPVIAIIGILGHPLALFIDRIHSDMDGQVFPSEALVQPLQLGSKEAPLDEEVEHTGVVDQQAEWLVRQVVRGLPIAPGSA